MQTGLIALAAAVALAGLLIGGRLQTVPEAAGGKGVFITDRLTGSVRYCWVSFNVAAECRSVADGQAYPTNAYPQQ